MTTLRTAAQQALKALEWISDCHVGDDDDAGECASCHERSYKPHAPDCKKNNAITALRTALAQQDEPQTLNDALTLPRATAQAYENGYKAGVAHEREACERACEHQPHWAACAAAIRARGNT